VGRILEAIGDEETIVITGDHGEEFGRYGGFHQMSLYSSMTQVPIIVRDAELESGTQESPAQHIDIPATLAYGADIDIPKHWHQTPLQSHKRSLDDPIFFDIGARTTGVRARQFKYITNRAEGYVELYNTPHMSADGPDVSNDYPEKCRELKEMIDSYLETVLPQAKKTGRMPFEGSQEQLKMDDRVEETLKELGYL
jgi:arylsulfatase A-like enzyme